MALLQDPLTRATSQGNMAMDVVYLTRVIMRI